MKKKSNAAPRGSLSIATFVLFSGGVAFAGHPVIDTDKSSAGDVTEPSWSEALFGTGLKTNNTYTDGNVFLTAPLWSTLGKDGKLGGNYLFLEPYTSVGSQGEVAASIGLGWRHLFSDEPRSGLEKHGIAGILEEGWFIGGNIFGDMLDTQHRNNFWQLGMGGEVGTRYFEMRGNYYCPLTGEKLYERDVSSQSFSSASQSAQTTFGDPFATGNSVVQPFNSVTTTTTTTTNTRTTTSLFEKGMRGWDAEAALLIPWVDQWMDCRVNAGYFHFDNQPFGPLDGPTGPVHGWKAGGEIRPVPAIVLGAEWYEDERFAGSNWVVSVEFQIPLDRDWLDAFKFRRRHLVEHLAEPVHRQNDAIRTGNREEQTSVVSVQQSSKVGAPTMGLVTLLNDIIFVNNGGAVGNGIQAGSASGNGTAQNPVLTLQIGASLAGANSINSGNLWTAYVQGGGANYTGVVTTIGSTRYFGSSQPIAGIDGKVFGGAGPNPTLDGAIVADGSAHFAINTVIVQGFTILNGDTVGGSAPINFTDVPNVVIANNTIRDANFDGIDVQMDKVRGPLTSNVVITGNTITGPFNDGISLNTSGNTVMIAMVSNNVVSNGGSSGVVGLSTDTSTLNVTAAGNIFPGNSGSGFDMESDGNSALVLAASGNQISQPGLFGVILSSFDSSSLTANISGNTIDRAEIGIYALPSNTTVGTGMNLDIAGNTITRSSQFGISLGPSNNAQLTATISGNTIANSRTTEISASAQDNAVTQVTITGNTILAGRRSVGIDLETVDTANFNATITGNTIQRFGASTQGDAIFLAGGTTGASFTATVSGNSIGGMPSSYYGVDAINVATLTIQGNTISTTLGSGIFVATGGAAVTSATITGNNVTAASDALALTSIGTSVITATISGNTFAVTTANNVGDIDSAANSSINATFTNNTVTGSTAAAGIVLESFDNSILTVNFSNATGLNAFAISSGPALKAISHDSSALNFTASGAQIIGGLDEAILVNSKDQSTLNSTFTGNTISGITGDGILAQADDNSLNNPNITLNNITNVGGNGIHLLAQNLSGAGATPVLTAAAVSNNSITNVGGNGIFVNASTSGQVQWTAINGNTIDSTSGDGIKVQADTGGVITGSSGDGTTGSIDNNIISNTTLHGIEITADTGSQISFFSLGGNTITGAGGNGILVIGNSASATISISSMAANIIRSAGTNGISFQATNGAQVTVGGYDRNVVGAFSTDIIGTNGMDFEVDANPATLVSVNGSNNADTTTANMVNATVGGDQLLSNPAASPSITGAFLVKFRTHPAVELVTLPEVVP